MNVMPSGSGVTLKSSKKIASPESKDSVVSGTERESPNTNATARSRDRSISVLPSRVRAKTRPSSGASTIFKSPATTAMDRREVMQRNTASSSSHLRNIDKASERSVITLTPLPQFMLDARQRARLGIEDPGERAHLTKFLKS